MSLPRLRLSRRHTPMHLPRLRLSRHTPLAAGLPLGSTKKRAFEYFKTLLIEDTDVVMCSYPKCDIADE